MRKRNCSKRNVLITRYFQRYLACYCFSCYRVATAPGFIDSSFMSYKDVAAGVVKDKPGGSLVKEIARWLISDEYAPSKYNSIALASNVVIAHCKNDKLIDISLGKKLFDNLISSDKQ